MRSKIKAVLCLDIDGTLTDEDEKMHPNDVVLLQKFPEDIQPILATGRHLISAKGILASNNVFKNIPLPIPSVFMNGGASYLPGEKLLAQHNFPTETLKALVELSKSFPETTFGFFSITSAYMVNPTQLSHHISKIHFLSSQDVNVKSIPEDIIKMMVIEKNKEKIREVEKMGAEINAEMVYSLPYLLEFTPPGINKAEGLTPLLKSLSLDNLPIYTAGDGQNDLGMFDFAVKSFAPTNAHPTILERADHIIERKSDGMIKPILDEIAHLSSFY